MLGLSSDQVRDLSPRLGLERYAEGEVIEPAGSVPRTMRYISSGQVSLRQPVATGNVAYQVETLVIPREVLDEPAHADHQLARQFGRQLDRRRTAIDDALAELAPTTA